ncbi:MAG: MarR family transcriptional regulator [Peptococcaceae bacterium]|jgi:DNA-binding MarR family transcriptional regulator|nr:MarR family transcriptional regulator [Peptococcaceae bacterium]
MDKKNDPGDRDLMTLLVKVEELLRFYHMHQFRNFGPFGSPHKGQGRILSILKMQPEISQKDLSYLLDMSRQAMSELLNKLEKAGYIERTPSPSDKRSLNITLTAAGKTAVPETLETNSDQLFDCLDEREQADFGAYLERIIAQLKKTLADMGMPQTHEDIRQKFFENHSHAFGDRGPFGPGAPFGRFEHDPRGGGFGFFGGGAKEEKKDETDR